MPRYRRKPKPIEAVEFDPGAPIEGVRIRKGEQKRGSKPFEVWNHKHSSWIGLEVGDMVRVDLAPGDVYPIARAYFEDNFEPMEES